MQFSRVKPRLKPTPFERTLAEMLKQRPTALKLRQATLQFQRAVIRIVLERHKHENGYNLSGVAHDLGIPRNSLYALLEKM